MTILHFIDSLARGGAETLLLAYVSQLRNYNNIIVILNDPNDFKNLTANLNLINLRAGNSKNIYAHANKIKKIIINNKVDIIHSHSFWTNIISRVAAPKNIKVINHYHFADYDTMANKPKVRAMLLLDRVTSHPRLIRIAVSEYVNNILKEKFGSKKPLYTLSNFIYHNCPGSIKNYFPAGQLRMVAVGSLKSEKGYSILFEAFKYLGSYNIVMDIYGGGANLEKYKEKALIEGLNLTFKGSSTSIQEDLKNYDLYVSTSFSETFGVALLEAVCAGLPLLVSRIPAFTEVAPEGTIFFESKNTKDFVEKIMHVYENGIMINREAYEQKLRYYTIDIFLKKLDLIYKGQLNTTTL